MSCTSGDDHPHADIRSGETFLAQTYNAVVSSPAWAKLRAIEWRWGLPALTPRDAAEPPP